MCDCLRVLRGIRVMCRAYVHAQASIAHAEQRWSAAQASWVMASASSGAVTPGIVDAVRRLAPPVVAMLTPLCGAVDDAVVAWIDEAAATCAQTAPQAEAMACFVNLQQARCRLWLHFDSCSWTPAVASFSTRGVNPRSVVGPASVVVWRWFLKALSEWISCLSRTALVPSTRAAIARVARMAPRISDELGLLAVATPAAAQVNDADVDVSWLLVQVRDSLWKLGGHPRLPQHVDAQRSQQVLHQLSRASGIWFNGDSIASSSLPLFELDLTGGVDVSDDDGGVVSASGPLTVSISQLLQRGHPSLYLSGREKQLLIAAIGFCEWGAAAPEAPSADANASAASSLLHAAFVKLLDERVVGPLTTALGASRAPRAAESAPVRSDHSGAPPLAVAIRLPFTVSQFGSAGHTSWVHPALIGLRRSWARATLWPLLESWALAEQHALLCAVMDVASRAHCRLATGDIDRDGGVSLTESRLLVAEAQSCVARMQSWLSFVVAGTPRPLDSVSPVQVLVWALHDVCGVKASTCSAADAASALSAFVDAVAHHRVELLSGFYWAVCDSAASGDVAVDAALSPAALGVAPQPHSAAMLGARAYPAVARAAQPLDIAAVFASMSARAKLMDAGASEYRAALLCSHLSGPRGSRDSVLDNEALLPLNCFVHSAVVFAKLAVDRSAHEAAVVGFANAAHASPVGAPLRDCANALHSVLAASSDVRLAQCGVSLVRPCLDAIVTAVEDPSSRIAVGAAWLHVRLRRTAVCVLHHKLSMCDCGAFYCSLDCCTFTCCVLRHRSTRPPSPRCGWTFCPRKLRGCSSWRQ